MFKWIMGGDDSDDTLDQLENDHKKTGIEDIKDKKSLDDYVSNLVDAEDARENN